MPWLWGRAARRRKCSQTTHATSSRQEQRKKFLQTYQQIFSPPNFCSLPLIQVQTMKATFLSREIALVAGRRLFCQIRSNSPYQVRFDKPMRSRHRSKNCLDKLLQKSRVCFTGGFVFQKQTFWVQIQLTVWISTSWWLTGSTTRRWPVFFSN